MDNVEIEIEKESHDNIGPSYSIKIGDNGTVEFNGKTNVKKVGKHILKISRDLITEIVDKFNMIYFFSLKDKYLSTSDPGSEETKTVVSVRAGDKFKKIEYSKNGKAPHSLDSLVSQIEKITKTDQFIGGQ
ncbi:MAG: DUF6438 domain-containing protein [Candidatus Nitrosocosmicus sp.]|nr:DUF6438 domain-containing protein [Candidatus Nitrosocosmicus sp.]MDN5867004.1 DUF6438 domain-containing protein [Candidatus Nitrosocosmicus sp.]